MQTDVRTISDFWHRESELCRKVARSENVYIRRDPVVFRDEVRAQSDREQICSVASKSR